MKVAITTILMMTSVTIKSQNIVASTGCYGQTTTGSLTWTIGEPIISTFSGREITLTQGFQQGKLSVTSISDDINSDLGIRVFPNPTINFFSIEVETDNQVEMEMHLYDIHGMLILHKQISSKKETVNMQNLAPAIYFLKISGKNKEIKAYKIIKQ